MMRQGCAPRPAVSTRPSAGSGKLFIRDDIGFGGLSRGALFSYASYSRAASAHGLQSVANSSLRIAAVSTGALSSLSDDRGPLAEAKPLPDCDRAIVASALFIAPSRLKSERKFIASAGWPD